MKKFYLFLTIVGLVITACQQTPKTVAVDIEAEKAVIDSLFNKFTSAFGEKDVAALASYLHEDALCLATDPSEFWNKQQMTEMWTQMLADFDPVLNYISKREIRVAADGNTATVVDQYIMPGFSPKILWRNAYHVIKTNGIWKINFLNCSFIPKNEDMPKLIEALQ